MFQIKQNEATAVRRRIPILLVDITDGFTPETGITAPTVNVSKNGAAIAAGAGTFTEIGNGQYYYEFTAGEVDTLGWIALNLEKATVTRDYNAVIQVMAYDAMDVVRLGLTAIPNVAQGTTGAISTGNATGQVTVATNNDKTGYALTQTFPANFSSLSVTVGGAVTAGTVSDKSGYSLSASQTFATTGAVGSVTGAVGSVTGAVGSVTGNVGGNVTGSVGSLTATAVQNIWDDLSVNNTVVGSIGKLLVDNVNATISSRSTLTDTQVWAAATRTLTAGTNIVLAKGTGITGFNDISVNNIWSETLPGSYTATQAGFKLNAAGSAADPWSTTLPGAYSAGTAGFIIGNRLDTTVGSRMATFTLPTNFSTLAITVGGAVTAGTVSDKTGYSLTTAPLTSGQTASAVWDALLASYQVNNSFGQRLLRSASAQATCAVTGSNHIAADVHEFQPGVITSIDFAADAITSTVLATSAVTEIQTGLATSSAVATVSAVTDKLNTAMQLDGAVYQFTVNALELAPSGGGGGGSTTIVANGPYNAIGDGLGSTDALDIQQSTAQDIVVRCVDANGSGVPLSGATVSAKVYNSAGTLVATYGGTITYAADGWLTFGLTTVVTNTVGTYTITITRTTSATDTSIYGPLRMYVRGI